MGLRTYAAALLALLGLTAAVCAGEAPTIELEGRYWFPTVEASAA
jgi:hypothetical protein